MRDIPFWFSFMALRALVGNIWNSRPVLPGMPARNYIRRGTACLRYICRPVRLFGLGDAADYDSVAFFGYAALLCTLLFALDIRSPPLSGHWGRAVTSSTSGTSSS